MTHLGYTGQRKPFCPLRKCSEPAGVEASGSSGSSATPASTQESGSLPTPSSTSPLEPPPKRHRPQLGRPQPTVTDPLTSRDHLSIDERDKKAVKSDDAAVPVHLWTDRHIATSPRWRKEDGPLLLGLMNLFRHFLFGRWCRNVVTSFFSWLLVSRSTELVAVVTKHPGAMDHFLVRDEKDWKWRKGADSAQWQLKEHLLEIQDKAKPAGFVRWDRKRRRFLWNCGDAAECQAWHREFHNVFQDDRDPAADAVDRACKADWWEWHHGSRPFHWRWPEFYQGIMRDGLPVHFTSKSPVCKVPQQDTKDPAHKKAVVKKLSKVRARGYIAAGLIISLTSFFAVPEGLDDIRMAYDGTKSGLNDATWTPGFWLPTVSTFLRMVDFNSWMSDLDIGEMFLNFILHCSLRPHCGVDLSHYFPSEIPKGATKLFEGWHRTGMGFKWSPCQAVQGMMALNEIIGGDRHDRNNVFRWDHVRLNLPGDGSYDPSLPWVSKVRSDGRIAADRVIFVDDVRTVGNSEGECHAATRRVGSVCSYHGIQDASRKRRQVSQRPGAWAGSVVWTGDNSVLTLVSDEKWDKTKAHLNNLRSLIDDDPEHLPRKDLERTRGFLTYVAQTYRGIKPCLNGLHLTIDGWRHDRDPHGWRQRRHGKYHHVESANDDEELEDMLDQMHAAKSDKFGGSYVEGPKEVKAVPRLLRDVAALEALVQLEKPPVKEVRSLRVFLALYGFGDASGPGFGVSFQFEGDDEIGAEFGQWPCSVSSEMSSNWRELANLVEFLERLGREGKLWGVELFIATDNSTAEAAYFKGYSSSPSLDALVLRIYILEMTYSFRLHLLHVSGKRMIDQGTDGLSRADRGTGSMQGHPVSKFLPLHQDAFERSPPLLEWIRDVTSGLGGTRFLKPEGWFEDAHEFGNFVWSPPPAAADVAVEQLSSARHKRPQGFHLVVVPRLMTAHWRKHLTRATDFYFKLEDDHLWPLKGQYEPVLIFVCMPLVTHRPNFEAGQRTLEEFERLLLGPGVLRASEAWFRSRLRKLFGETRELCAL